MSQNLSSAAVVIGALRVKFISTVEKKNHSHFECHNFLIKIKYKLKKHLICTKTEINL